MGIAYINYRQGRVPVVTPYLEGRLQIPCWPYSSQAMHTMLP